SDLPLTVGLIVDVSGSQAGLVGKHRETVARFIQQVLRPQDHAMLVTVGPAVHLLTDFTNSVTEFNAGIDRIHWRNVGSPTLGEACQGIHARGVRGRRARAGRSRRSPCGGTVLWDSIYYASRLKMKGVTGRKALLVLTDG